VSAVGSIIEYMFESLPADVAALRGLDEAALIDTVAGWARASAASDAMKYAAIAEFERRRCTDEHPNWACDDWDAAAAEIAAALNTGHGRASGEMDLAIMLRDRFPKVGALFLAGELNARRVWLISDRTYLVTDPDALAELDSVIAERLTTWGPLSEYKLTQAIDVWVDKIDPAALRRTRNSARTRDFTVAESDATGTAAVFGRLFSTDAALLKQRLEVMARSVCEDDPRTLAQRRADALGALAAGSQHLSGHDVSGARLRPPGGVRRHRPHGGLSRRANSSGKPQVLLPKTRCTQNCVRPARTRCIDPVGRARRHVWGQSRHFGLMTRVTHTFSSTTQHLRPALSR
jgi:hypothetical protein